MTEIFNVSLKDFLITIRKSWQVILAFGGIGLACAFIYLFLAPKLYLASGQIQLSQTRAANYEWVNIEDPNILIARVKSPANISDKTLLACQYSSAADLTKHIQLGLIKTVPPTLDVTIKHSSPDVAKACAEAIIEEIKASQDSQIAKKSIYYQGLIQDYLIDLNKLKREYSQVSLSKRDFAVVDEIVLKERIRLTTEKIFTLGSFILSADEGSGKLLAPIYVSSSPIPLKRFITVVAGLLLGVFVGLLICIFHSIYLPRIKALS
jgi:capsular polysaccharide biosynthesis protein